MGNNAFTPLIPVAGAPLTLSGAFKDKDKGGSVAAPTAGTTSPYNTPGLFEPYQKYIPEAMNSNQPINDPTSILRAYADNLPEFRLAAQGSPTTPDVSQSLGSRQQKSK